MWNGHLVHYSISFVVTSLTEITISVALTNKSHPYALGSLEVGFITLDE
jgi:hypothetical protein